MNRKMISRRQYLWLGIAALTVIFLDQMVKYLVVRNIPMFSKVPVWNGVIHLTYVRNTGAAFSILSGSRWLFVVLMVVFLMSLALLVWKKIIYRPIELWCLTAVAAGGVGNAVDRVIYGSVVDMFEVEFINFAVFNVADCFITCGAIILVVYELFFCHESKKSKGETI